MKRYLFCLSCLMSFIQPVIADGFSPYVLDKRGNYAVINSSEGKKLQEGWLFQELLSNTTYYPEISFLANNDYIYQAFWDVPNNRLFLATGANGENGIDGVLVLRLSDRGYIRYISTPAELKEFGFFDVSPDNKIHFSADIEDGKQYPDTAVNLVTYDGTTYKKIPSKGLVNPWVGSSNYGCYIPGEGSRFYDFHLNGIYDFDKETVNKSTYNMEGYWFCGCENGRALFRNKMTLDKKVPDFTLYVKDIEKNRIISNIKPENASWNEWFLTKDGAAVVYSERKDLSYVGKFAFYNVSSGKKNAELDIRKTQQTPPGSMGMRFYGFSADGNKLIYYSDYDDNIYLISVITHNVVGKVKSPIYPATWQAGPDATGFIVWP